MKDLIPGTFVYLKNQEKLYKYIVYRPDIDVFVLEQIAIAGEKYHKYVNIASLEYNNNYCTNIKDIKKNIKQTLNKYCKKSPKL